MTSAPVHSVGTAGAPASAGGRTIWAALAPTREAMLGRARRRAADIVAQARREADETRADARRRGTALLVQGRQQGRAAAEPLVAAEDETGRRNARHTVLAAQREAYEELRGRVQEAVCALRGSPGYPPLRQQLAEVATRLAGPGAMITEDPAGGVAARAPGIVVDCSLPRLADAAMETLDAAALWEPERPGPP